MNAIKQKLKSRAGASITFALLIFLVCAMVSTVVIVAATASAGRMSGVKETDQRYYAALAAAENLQAIFDNQSAEVTYNPGDMGDASAEASNGSEILENASIQCINGVVPSVTTWSFNSEDDVYTCAISQRMDGGLLYFDISATGGTENINTGTYRLTIAFSSNVKKPKPASGSTTATATVSWKLHSLSKGRATSTSTT